MYTYMRTFIFIFVRMNIHAYAWKHKYWFKVTLMSALDKAHTTAVLCVRSFVAIYCWVWVRFQSGCVVSVGVNISIHLIAGTFFGTSLLP